MGDLLRDKLASISIKRCNKAVLLCDFVNFDTFDCRDIGETR